MASLSPTLTSQMIRRAINPAIWTAITSAPSGVRITMLLRSLSTLAAGRSAVPNKPGPMDRGDHLTPDGRALHVRVEYRQEDADPGPRLVAQPEFRRWRRVLDEADLTVGRGDDHTRPGGRDTGRVPEEGSVGGRSGKAGRPRPTMPAAQSGHSQAAADEGQTRPVHRWDLGTDQLHHV